MNSWYAFCFQGRHAQGSGMSNNSQAPWPELPTAAWRDTCATLQLWTQIVGKIRLAKSPWLNHSWHVALYVTPRGLTTSPVPDGPRSFQIDFDLIDHRLRISTSDGAQRGFALLDHSVASFYAATLAALGELGIAVAIDEMPNELPDPIKFSEDTAHASYDADAVRRFLQILVNSDRVFKQFRTGFLGKASPVHFFWGSFDLAVTRFSGRRARGLFTRSQQRRLLARQWRDRLSRVLFLCLSRAIRLPRGEGSAGGGVLQRSARRVHPALRCGAHGCRSRQGAARFPAEHL
jgi:hypothetical protein